MSAREMIEEKTKDICSLIDATVCSLKSYMDNGIEQADTKEVGEVTDIIKDLAEAYSEIIEGIYHKTITEAMEEYPSGYHKVGIDSQHKVGSTYMRDMDYDDGKMYFSPMTMQDARMGRSGHSRVRFYETKADHMTNSDADTKAKKERMEEYMDDIYDDIDEMLKGESVEMKTMARQKLISMANAM